MMVEFIAGLLYQTAGALVMCSQSCYFDLFWYPVYILFFFMWNTGYFKTSYKPSKGTIWEGNFDFKLITAHVHTKAKTSDDEFQVDRNHCNSRWTNTQWVKNSNSSSEIRWNTPLLCNIYETEWHWLFLRLYFIVLHCNTCFLHLCQWSGETVVQHTRLPQTHNNSGGHLKSPKGDIHHCRVNECTFKLCKPLSLLEHWITNKAQLMQIWNTKVSGNVLHYFVI